MPNVRTIVDLARIRANAQAIRDRAGVPLIAVVKADAYGHGAVAVADAIDGLADAFYVFHPIESATARLFELTGRPTIAGAPMPDDDAARLKAIGVRPAVWTPAMATRYASLDPILSVDTGMQRFAATPAELDAMFAAYRFTEAMTHGTKPEHAAALRASAADRGAMKLHAAGTALMDDPSSRLDAIRPGLALYSGAARVLARLADVRRSVGPAGYSGFASTTHHGVILAGYSHGLRAGPCSVNGRPQRLVEVGMQTAYVSLDAADQAGDEVELLGPNVLAADVAAAWRCGTHEATHSLVTLGEREYVDA